MLRITTKSGLISHWIRMLQIFGGPRSSAASLRYLSSAASIINTSGFRFWIGTTAGNEDKGALGHEPLCCGETDSTVASGDNSYFAVKSSSHRDNSLRSRVGRRLPGRTR